jgi:serine protease
MHKVGFAALAFVSVLAIAASALAAPSDPYFSRQWGLVKIGAEQAWAVADGTGVLIAIVDTGVDLGHPDLAAKLVSKPDADMVEPKGTDGAQDKNGHGTHGAGIAGAVTNNGVGVAGTARGARILPVRVLDASGSGTTDQVAAGIRYATANGAKVINLSLGVMSGVDQVAKIIGALDPIYQAIDAAWAAGVVVVIAGGNDSFVLCAEPSAHPKAVCVGAIDQRDVRTFYSNSDATMTSTFVVAPGGDALTCSGDIFSTYLRSEPKSVCSPEQGYEALAGTSMATPFVSGVAALLSGKGLTNQQIVSCLRSTSTDLGIPGRDPVYGYGRVNALAAVTTC